MRLSKQDDVKMWWSFKFKGSAMRYEVATAVATGFIVWISRGFPAGANPDISIFRKSGLKELLLESGEKTIADLGYRGEPEVINTPNVGTQEYQDEMKEIRGRHETVNKRFKNWGVMKGPFRHSPVFHNTCFEAVAVLTQIMMERGEPLFQVG